MSDRIKLPLEKEGTGTPFGNSFYESYDMCPTKGRLEREHGDTIIKNDPTRKPQAARVGTLYHQLMWAYQLPAWPEGVELAEDDGMDPDWTEALRMFHEYQKHYPPGEMNAIGLEDDFKIVDQDAFGVPVITGQWDAIPFFETEEQVAEFENRRALTVKGRDGVERTRKFNLRGPGIYILDTKTSTSKKGDIALKYNEAIQQALYAMAWDYLHPNNPIKGTIIAHVARHNAVYTKKAQEKTGERVTGMRPDSFTWIFVPPPNEHMKEVVRSTMQRRNARVLLDPFRKVVNTAMCFHWGVCPFLEDGTCDRIGKPVKNPVVVPE